MIRRPPRSTPLSLHDALPICKTQGPSVSSYQSSRAQPFMVTVSKSQPMPKCSLNIRASSHTRSEEHTSELQSPCNLVCRLLLEKKTNGSTTHSSYTESHITNT